MLDPRPLVLVLGTALASVAGPLLVAAPQRLASQDGPPPAAEEAQPPQPVVLDRQQTLDLVATYRATEHWTVKGLVIVSLGESWSPDAAPVLVEALTGKQLELRAFALETLHQASDACVRSSATKELVVALIDSLLADKDEHVAGRAQMLLTRIFPDAGHEKRPKWQAHWRAVEETYAPAEWTPPPPKPKDGPTRTVAGAVGRALDLRDAGLEICFCVDATGSMQPMLEATAGAAEQMSNLLAGFAPDLRVGAVFYKDMEDLSGGAKLVHELTDKHEKVFKKIGDISADGGGDTPEAVERGLEVALDPRELGWKVTTNKLVIVMGDAPPHPPDVPRAVETARIAATVGLDPKKVKGRPTSGKTETPRPVVVSCIGVSPGAVPPDTEDAFRQIAAAGGGAYAALNVGGGEAQLRAASQGIVTHVLRMAFGERWKDEVDVFLAIYFAYRERGYFD
jgi:Mg-chelatase subunit ChlD